MVKNIVKDVFFLSMKSSPATVADAQTAQDLIDTLISNKEHCVGLAANMIGVRKNIIVFEDNSVSTIMYNPVITKKELPYQTEEGCLSLKGVRPTIRFGRITVEFQDAAFKKQTKSYEGFTAQIIQHEIDHLSGIII